MIAKKWRISSGIGSSAEGLPSFDKALIDAGVGNYNLVRLSSILPAYCDKVDDIDTPEGSLLPTAYSTITSDTVGDIIISTIGVGLPKDKSKVGVIMEYSTKNTTVEAAMETLYGMIREAFTIRGWELENIISTHAYAVVEENRKYTTFACIAEWE